MTGGALPFNADFTPAWWCRGPHMQTLWPHLFRFRPRPQYRRERVRLSDGDFIDLDWHGPAPGKIIVVVLHGLEGNSGSHYVRGIVAELAKRNISSVVMHQRGCSGEPNVLDRRYHAGNSIDLREVLALLRHRYQSCWFHAVGYSLGGNVLLKYLGEPEQVLLDSACAVSVPFVLSDCAERLDQGASRLYRKYLVGQMQRAVREKFRDRPAPIDIDSLSQWRSFFAFDEHVTAPLHGFTGARDYYKRCSSRQFLPGITTPTLIVQALDDPFMTPNVLPKTLELGTGIRFELSRHGGHVGFVSGNLPGLARYWLDRRLCGFIEQAARARHELQ